MALNVLTATIPAGQAVSTPVDCSGSVRIVRIIMPDAWTSAPLTFCLSPDNTTFHDLYLTPDGSLAPFEVTVPTVTPGSIVGFPPNTGYQIAWFKLRSGVHAVPVPQAADRVFKIVVQVLDASIGGTGTQGPTGPRGLDGPTGATGVAGVQGPTGSGGTTGPTGTASGKGVTDGSVANPGDKGEYISAFNATGLNLVTAVSANVVSISLPPGDFDIWGAVIFTPTSTGPNSLSAGISGTSATLPSNTDIISGFGTMAEIWSGSITSGKRQVYPTGQCTSNFATAKTVYLVAQSTFGGGSINVTGYISARRAR